MAKPVTIKYLRLNFHNNVIRRFRIKNNDTERRKSLVYMFERRFRGFWAFEDDGNENLIIYCEDQDDIKIVKTLYYESWKRPKISKRRR